MVYHDAYEVYDLLDKWNLRGPPLPENIRDLFHRHPDAAKQVFLTGQTLLHKCLEFYSNRMDLVQLFLEANPKALAEPDDNGFLPLHRALISANCPPSLELIQFFVHEYPEAILTAIPSGALPLHLASSRADQGIVQYLVDCFPDAVQYRDNEGKFPLDHAFEAANPQDDVVELLIERYPVLLSFLDHDGRLPLHRILQKHRKRYNKIVDLVIDYCPGGLRLQDAQGQTPLLQACCDNNSLSQVYSLVRKWPEQVTTQCDLIMNENVFNGEMLPSALASQSARLDRVQEWVRLHPEVLFSPDLQGRLPIHYAVLSESKEAMEIVQFLMDLEPSSKDHDDPDISSSSCLAVADHHGRLPLHYAAASGSAVTEILMEAYPEGLLHSDQDGRLPWHYADCARHDIVFDRTCQLYPDTETDLDLVPDEIRWDVIQVAGRE
jgi:ankyrin repeat protein